jgi:hypothetical protein
MIDKVFYIEGNEYSPSATFYSDNKLVIEGESRLENPKEFYNQLYSNLEKSLVNTTPEVIEFYFEYISSSSILCLISLIKNLVKYKDIPVFWMHDENDEDIQELGEIIKETHEIPLIIKGV